MESTNEASSKFLEKLRAEVNANLTNEQFGVEELARNMGTSRSQLHRKLITATGQSVSQFIREYRLQLGMELLKKGELTAAEVADRIGFGSPSYFNTCFNEYYGFPPGEVKNKLKEPLVASEPVNTIDTSSSKIPLRKSSTVKIILIGITFFAVAFLYITYANYNQSSVNYKDKSIAILPFKNLSDDQRNEYFGDGVLEAICTALSHIEQLRVISRTSVEQFRESKESAGEIARELGVATLLEGSIQRENNRVRIDVRLVDGATEEQIWAKSYDRELKDIFTVQSEIAQQVANALHANLSPEEKSQLTQTGTVNPKAYDLYLKAVFEFRTYTNRGAHNAIDLLTQAIALDSSYAQAHAFLANSYLALASIFGAELSALDAFQKAKPFIDKALQLNQNLDEAHMLLGYYYLYNDWNFKAAEEEYRLAIKSDHPDALTLYADYLNFMSRHEEAVVWAERLNAVDPYYPNSRIVLSYMYNDRLEDALAFSETRLKLFNNYYTLDSHGFLLLYLKRYEESIVYFNKAIALEGIRYPRMLGWMGAAYGKLGQRTNAIKIIEELKARSSKNKAGSEAFFIAVVYSALDEKDLALSWLKTSYERHDMEMPWLMTEPQFYSLHSEPEFQQLAKQMGFK